MSAWAHVQEPGHMQGDYLPHCLVPVFEPDFDPTTIVNSGSQPIQVDEFDLIVITQSCDLENGKTRKVALCPIYTIQEYETSNPGFISKKWENVRKGRVFGLHSLPPLPDTSTDAWLVVDFREIFSLSYKYITKHAETLQPRWSLQSPYLEHFSRAFGDLFSRVALP